MNSYIYASSRGRSLSDVNCKSLRVVPGGKLRQLCEFAVEELSSVQGPKIVYFIAGIPDICTLNRDRKSNYEENFLDMSKKHVECYKEILVNVEQEMQHIGCKVVFGTITTISFKLWNEHRLAIGKTKYLKYEVEYAIMQERLNEILHSLNNFITELNTRNGVFTPFLHSPVMKQRKNGNFKYSYSKLVDGVHPSSELSKVWSDRMSKAISMNYEKFVE